MKKFKIKPGKLFKNKKFKYGGYAAAITIFVIAGVMLLNYLVTTLDNYFNLSIDMTETRIYSLTNQTETILEKLDEEIYIYTTYDENLLGNINGDTNIIEMLENYDSASKMVEINNIDILDNPGAVSFYRSEGHQINQGDVIVTNSEDMSSPDQRYWVLDSYDFNKYNSNTQQYDIFDGEKAVTRSILYVINPNYPNVWILDGHNTSTIFYNTLEKYLEEENYPVKYLNLMSAANDLQKGDILICLAPDIDLLEKEREILTDFALEGGRMFLGFDPALRYQVSLPEFESLLSLYNVSIEDGIIVETNPYNAIDEVGMSIIPNMGIHEITSVLKSNNQFVILPYTGYYAVGALSIPNVISDNSVEIDTLLYTDDTAFLEPFDANMDGQPNEDARFDEFPIMIAITNEDYYDETNNVKIIVTTSPAAFMFTTEVKEYYGAGNDEMFINIISWLSPIEDDLYIRGKSLNSSILYIQTTGQKQAIILIVCVILPMLILAAGIVIYLKRRHL